MQQGGAQVLNRNRRDREQAAKGADEVAHGEHLTYQGLHLWRQVEGVRRLRPFSERSAQKVGLERADCYAKGVSAEGGVAGRGRGDTAFDV